MKLHFGSLAEKEGMLIDFESMKREYQRYERWNPVNRLHKEYTDDFNEKYVQTMTKELLDKTKKERYGKFDFQ
jgi:hypothetical protein